MQLQNKIVAVLGDSITEGVGTSSIDNRYANVFEKLSNSKVLNYGISATRIARQKDLSTPGNHDDFIRRVDDIDSSAEIIVVFGGTNDFGHGDAPFGEFKDDTPYTFYGAMHVLCKKLINKFPNSQIVFMTPLHRLSELNTTNDWGLGCKPLKEYVRAIKEVCEYYSLPVLDLFATSGMQPAVEIIRETYMPDGLHPNDKGARLIAERLYGFLSAL